MKPLRLVHIVVAVSLALLTALSFGEVQSLRGSTDVVATTDAPDKLKFKKDKENIPRTFEEQPPLVPHLNDKYTISLTENKCLECHMKQPGKDEAKSVEISESHFVDRDGNRLDKPAGGRHFCTQCHVPQADAQPLIGSNFQSIGR